jgi:uncharacterized protein (TIGR03435 family)
MKYFLFAVAGLTLVAQDFEVVSIRPSEPMSDHANVGIRLDGSQMTARQLTLKDYVGIAYQVKIYQINGPDSLSERFDIAAKLPGQATMDQVPGMMQKMLEERFQLKYHKEKKDFPVYALVTTKGGIKAKPTPVEPNAPDAGDAPKPAVNVTGTGNRGGVNINLGNGSSFSLADNKFVARKLTMTQVADTLARFEDKPVINMTEVSGAYDFELLFTQEDYMAMLIRSAVAAGVTLPPEALKMMESSGDSLVTALEKVGLKLESRKLPLDVIVIDHLAKSPTEN